MVNGSRSALRKMSVTAPPTASTSFVTRETISPVLCRMKNPSERVWRWSYTLSRMSVITRSVTSRIRMTLK